MTKVRGCTAGLFPNSIIYTIWPKVWGHLWITSMWDCWNTWSHCRESAAASGASTFLLVAGFPPDVGALAPEMSSDSGTSGLYRGPTLTLGNSDGVTLTISAGGWGRGQGSMCTRGHHPHQTRKTSMDCSDKHKLLEDKYCPNSKGTKKMISEIASLFHCCWTLPTFCITTLCPLEDAASCYVGPRSQSCSSS